MIDELLGVEEKHGAGGLEPSRWENIPRSLRGAGYLQWSADSDAPRRPHAKGDFGVSWSDPEDWLSFDEAVESSKSTAAWGIGYVNAANNDDFETGHRFTIDIDGAISSDGELRDWVPSLEPFLEHGAYMEYSPSLAVLIELFSEFDDPDVLADAMEEVEEFDGAGLHIPVRNAEVPEWWSDSEIAPDVHQGVDVLANKFSTVTGLKYDGAGAEVVEYGPWIDEWLAEAYQNIRGEAPPRGRNLSEFPEGDTSSNERTGASGNSRSSDSRDYPKASREDVEEALSHVGYATDEDHPSSAALHYNEWRDIAYAVHSWDDGPTGREVFVNWSKGSPKWEEPESSEVVDWIWNNADPDGDGRNNISVGTLFHHASQNGWDGPSSDDFTLSPKAQWASWAHRRTIGELGPESVIPEAALEFVARDRGFYDFEPLAAGVDELPPKAHNSALSYVKNYWPADHPEAFGEDEQITARRYRDRTSAPARTWEDVRYIYEDDKEQGRKAARSLLSSEYEFMTVADTETLQVYDPETGVFTDETWRVRAELYDGLGKHWSTHELREVTAGLRQENVVQPQHLDAAARDDPLICVGDGVLNPLTGELLEHNPEYHFVSRTPTEWGLEADTEVYEDFVGSLVGREADKQALFEMVGHALMPDANERYKKFLILTGDADNGKSQFFSCVSSLLNGPNSQENNTASVKLAKLAQNKFSIHSMYSHMANIAGEIDGKKIRNTANLKDITGGDVVELEPKGVESFFDTVNTTLMFAANDPPILGERDKKAIATRIVPIELPFEFVDEPEEDYQKEREEEDVLRDRLETPKALSGLLHLAVEGIQRLEENGGDVSLPETHEERLERYERSADPMREFGAAALANDPNDYVVKADITTLYKEFARSRGYEVGSNINSVLHGVLRGVNNLDYTDSKPREPDYSDTSLPLQGWGERKEVVDRVTLTEEGLALAEKAGLLLDPEEVEGGDSSAVTALGARDLGHGQSIVAKVKNVSEGEYGRISQGQLKGPQGTYIGFVIPGGNANQLAGKQGKSLQFDNVTLRTDEDGLRQAVISDATEVEIIEDGPSADSSVEQTPAATDGGATEFEQLEPKVKQEILENYEPGDTVKAPHVAGSLGESPEAVEKTLEGMARKGGRGVMRHSENPDAYQVE